MKGATSTTCCPGTVTHSPRGYGGPWTRCVAPRCPPNWATRPRRGRLSGRSCCRVRARARQLGLRADPATRGPGSCQPAQQATGGTRRRVGIVAAVCRNAGGGGRRRWWLPPPLWSWPPAPPRSRAPSPVPAGPLRRLPVPLGPGASRRRQLPPGRTRSRGAGRQRRRPNRPRRPRRSLRVAPRRPACAVSTSISSLTQGSSRTRRRRMSSPS